MQKSTLARIATGIVLGFVPLTMVFAGDVGGGNTGPMCYFTKLFDVNQTVTGSCSNLYTECPGRVLCAIGATNNKISNITFAPYPCICYSGGSYDSTLGKCVGGTKQTSCNTTTTIYQQQCTGGCP